VDDYLADVPNKHEDLPEIVVAFCIVTEKLFKIKLHDKNPVLVYENSKIKENDALVTIVKNKELDTETIRIKQTFERYKLMFDKKFSDDDIQVLFDIYNARNHFVHGYRSDDHILSDVENIIKKMGTVWEKISNLAVTIFGKDLIKANKPKKKYSEEELEKVFMNEVETKIQPTNEDDRSHYLGMYSYDISNSFGYHHFSDEKCPRCGFYGFSLDSSQNIDTIAVQFYMPRGGITDLYKCKRCNLELTRKEYEIAKKIRQQEL